LRPHAQRVIRPPKVGPRAKRPPILALIDDGNPASRDDIHERRTEPGQVVKVNEIRLCLVQEDVELALECTILDGISCDRVAAIEVIDHQSHPNAVVVIREALAGGAAFVRNSRKSRYVVALNLLTGEVPRILLGATAIERRPSVDDVEDR